MRGRVTSDWTALALCILGQIPSISIIVNKCHHPGRHTRNMWEISQTELREEQHSITLDLERPHFVTTNLQDLNFYGVVSSLNSLRNIQSQSRISGLIMASTPLMLLTIRADLNCCLDILPAHYETFMR